MATVIYKAPYGRNFRVASDCPCRRFCQL